MKKWISAIIVFAAIQNQARQICDYTYVEPGAYIWECETVDDKDPNTNPGSSRDPIGIPFGVGYWANELERSKDLNETQATQLTTQIDQELTREIEKISQDTESLSLEFKKDIRQEKIQLNQNSAFQNFITSLGILRVDLSTTPKELLLNTLDSSGASSVNQTSGMSDGSTIDAIGIYERLRDPYIYKSEKAPELRLLDQRLRAHQNRSPQQFETKQMAFRYLKATDQTFLQGQKSIGERLFQISKFLVDISTDIIPITSVPKDAYRLLIGKDPMSGLSLSPTERGIAAGFFVFGVMTLGASNVFKLEAEVAKVALEASEQASAKVAAKMIENSERLGVQTFEEFKHNKNLLAALDGNVEILKVDSGKVVNDKFFRAAGREAAYVDSKIVVEGMSKSEMKLMRAHLPGEPSGRWLGQPNEMSGRTAKELKEIFNLKREPGAISEAVIPAGEKMRIGEIGPNAFGDSEGAIQIELLREGKIPDKWFVNERGL